MKTMLPKLSYAAFAMLLAATLIAPGAWGQCTEISSSGAVYLEGDGMGYVRHSSTISSGDSRTITDLDVKVNITYPYVSELRLIVRSPGGTEVMLESLGGATGANYTDTVFDQDAATGIDSGSAPFTGCFRPVPSASLDNFNGLSASGTWTLYVDVYSFDMFESGWLNGWSLMLDCDCGGPIETPPTANFTANVTSGEAPLAVQFTDTSDPGSESITDWDWDFGDLESSTAPSPPHTYDDAGTYTVSLTVTTSVDSDTETKVGYITVTEPVVEDPRDCHLYHSDDAPVAIPDQDTITSTATVPHSRTIAEALVILDISHTAVGDLEITLESPLATSVVLSSYNGGNGDDFATTVFDQDAATAVTAGSAPFTGFYVPEEALSGFDGEDAEGTWTLSVEDCCTGDTGTLNSWSLLLDCDCVGGEANSVAVPWYVDIAGEAQRLPAEDGKVTTLVYLHNNQSVGLLGFIEYYTQDGVYVGPGASGFAIPPDASVAFRPVANDPASVMGGQEADVGLAIPNRPLGTEGGNDNKKNGSIVIRWFGDSTDIQGQTMTFHNKAANGGPYSFASLLPKGIGPQTGGVGACALGVPWYVDIAGEAQGLPPADGKLTSLVYLHNNLSAELNCTIEYFTKDGISIGPDPGSDGFSIDPNASIGFRPAADDPSTVQGGQEGVPGRAVPNRPMGTEDGNDDKKNGSIVIRWLGRPTDVQGNVTSYRMLVDGPYASSVLLPPGNFIAGDEAAMAGSWIMDYSWTSKPTVTWYLASDGTFTTSSMGEGTWGALGSLFLLQYTGGGETVYTGTITSPTHMEGTMESNSGSGGTWFADRIVR